MSDILRNSPDKPLTQPELKNREAVIAELSRRVTPGQVPDVSEGITETDQYSVLLDPDGKIREATLTLNTHDLEAQRLEKPGKKVEQKIGGILQTIFQKLRGLRGQAQELPQESSQERLDTFVVDKKVGQKIRDGLAKVSDSYDDLDRFVNYPGDFITPPMPVGEKQRPHLEEQDVAGLSPSQLKIAKQRVLDEARTMRDTKFPETVDAQPLLDLDVEAKINSLLLSNDYQDVALHRSLPDEFFVRHMSAEKKASLTEEQVAHILDLVTKKATERMKQLREVVLGTVKAEIRAISSVPALFEYGGHSGLEVNNQTPPPEVDDMEMTQAVFKRLVESANKFNIPTNIVYAMIEEVATAYVNHYHKIKDR